MRQHEEQHKAEIRRNNHLISQYGAVIKQL